MVFTGHELYFIPVTRAESGQYDQRWLRTGGFDRVQNRSGRLNIQTGCFTTRTRPQRDQIASTPSMACAMSASFSALPTILCTRSCSGIVPMLRDKVLTVCPWSSSCLTSSKPTPADAPMTANFHSLHSLDDCVHDFISEFTCRCHSTNTTTKHNFGLWLHNPFAAGRQRPLDPRTS